MIKSERMSDEKRFTHLITIVRSKKVRIISFIETGK